MDIEIKWRYDKYSDVMRCIGAVGGHYLEKCVSINEIRQAKINVMSCIENKLLEQFANLMEEHEENTRTAQKETIRVSRSRRPRTSNGK